MGTALQHLADSLSDLKSKLVVEEVVVQSFLAFDNRLFLVPKPNNKWRPILDLSKLNLFLQPGTFKIETPETIRVSLKKGEWVTSLDFSDAYFHIPISQRSRNYLRFFLGKKSYQFTALPFGLATAPLEFTKVVKEVKLMTDTGYPDPPVPRRLVTVSPVPGNLPTTYPDTLGPLPRLWLGSKPEEVRTGFPAGFQFRRLPVRPSNGSGFAHSGKVVCPATEIKGHQKPELLFSQAIHVPDRTSHCHREASLVRSPSYEAHSVASEATLACPREPGKDYSNPSLSPPPSRLVVRRRPCPQGSTFTPSSARSAIVYRRLKRRQGRTLRGLHCKRRVVRTRKPPTHQLFGVESSPAGSQEL